MELKLENNLAHQTMPVDGVAVVVEASIQGKRIRDAALSIFFYLFTFAA